MAAEPEPQIVAPHFPRANTADLDEDDHFHTRSDYNAAWNEYLLAYDHEVRRGSVNPESAPVIRSKIANRRREISFSRRTDSELSVSTLDTNGIKRKSREFSVGSDGQRKSQKIDSYTSDFMLERFGIMPEEKAIEFKKDLRSIDEDAMTAAFKRSAKEFTEEAQREQRLDIPSAGVAQSAGDSSDDDEVDRLLNNPFGERPVSTDGSSSADEIIPSLPFVVTNPDGLESDAILSKAKRKESRHVPKPSIVLSGQIWSEMQRFEEQLLIRRSLGEEAALKAQMQSIARTNRPQDEMLENMSESNIKKGVNLISEVQANFESYRTPGEFDDDEKEREPQPKRGNRLRLRNHNREMTVDDIEHLIEMAAANKQQAQIAAVEQHVANDDGVDADDETDDIHDTRPLSSSRSEELKLEQTEVEQLREKGAYVDGYNGDPPHDEDEGKSSTFIIKGSELQDAFAQMAAGDTSTVVLRPDMLEEMKRKYNQEDDDEQTRQRLGYLADGMVQSNSARELAEIENERQEPPSLERIRTEPRDEVYTVTNHESSRHLANENLAPRKSLETSQPPAKRSSIFGRVKNGIFGKKRPSEEHPPPPPPPEEKTAAQIIRSSTRQLLLDGNPPETRIGNVPLQGDGRARARGIDPTNPVTKVYHDAHPSEPEMLHYHHESLDDDNAGMLKPVYREVEDILQANPESVQRANFDRRRVAVPPRRDTATKRVEVDHAGLSNLRKKFTRLDDSVLKQPEYIPTPTEKRRRGCGRLIVKVVGGLCLQGSDWGSTNPYCIVKVRKAEAQTKYVRNDLNPIWKELLVFNNYKPKPGLEAVLVCMNKKRLTKDSVIGMAPFVLPDSFASLHKVPLEIKSKRGSARGVIVLYTFVQRYVFNFPS